MAYVNLSQPAISQAIASVERAVGERLFDRSERGMFLTEPGRVFTRRIDRAIGYLQTGAQAIALRKDGPADGLQLSRLATTVQLRSLISVVESGGYSAAARQLGVTQPNIHRAIRDLERLAGRKLFQRSRLGAAATRETLVLARCINLAFREVELGVEEVREGQGLLHGSVLIGALPLIRTRILPMAVTRLLAQYPDAKVKIIEAPYSELINHLRDSRIDLILGALRTPAPDDLQQEELLKESLAVVVRAGHPILKSRALDAADLARLEWIAPPPQTPAGASFAAFFRRQQLPFPGRIIECSSFVTARDLLVRSDRAALLSASQVDDESLADKLAIAVPKVPHTERPIGVCTRLDWSPTRMQSRFLALVREIVEETPKG